eukprot:PhF_6_TR8261/c3_g1_i3/m.12573
MPTTTKKTPKKMKNCKNNLWRFEKMRTTRETWRSYSKEWKRWKQEPLIRHLLVMVQETSQHGSNKTETSNSHLASKQSSQQRTFNKGCSSQTQGTWIKTWDWTTYGSICKHKGISKCPHGVEIGKGHYLNFRNLHSFRQVDEILCRWEEPHNNLSLYLLQDVRCQCMICKTKKGA